MNFLPMIGLLFTVASIAFLAYVFTKLLSGKAKKAMSGKYISIVETVSLGLDKNIYLVRIENQFVLLASPGKSIEFLTNVKIDEFHEAEKTQVNGIFDFKSILDKYINVYKDKRSDKNSKKGSKEILKGNESKFEFTEEKAFKSNLNKLKDMTLDIYKKSKEDGDDS